jgi:hypothetical protein
MGRGLYRGVSKWDLLSDVDDYRTMRLKQTQPLFSSFAVALDAATRYDRHREFGRHSLIEWRLGRRQKLIS